MFNSLHQLRNWEIMLHQFSQLSVEIPLDVVVTQIMDGAREMCVRVLHLTFAIAFRDASRDTLRQDRGPHTRVNAGQERGGTGRRGTTNFHVLAQKSNSIARVKCNASLAGPGLTSPRSRNFPEKLSLPSLTYYLSNYHATANFFAEVWPWRG